MAIEQLTKPILNPIAAFDALLEHTFVFTAIGGAQVRGNRLIISENQTGNQVYNELQVTNGLYHILPANTLKNGGYYNAVIYTLDNANNESEPSIAVPFYCYSTPHLSFTNIPSSGTIENGTYEFQGTYSQAENEALNSYQFTLYDSNKDILSQTDLIYYQSDSSLSHTFVGMSNDTSYFIQLTGETVNNTKVDSGLISFTVRYLQPASFSICDLVNDCENGYIQISSNIVAIDGKSNPEPPKYIDNKEVDLRDKGDWVRWDEGFDIKNDFTMRAWGRDFNPYEKIITLANRNDTDDNYNKIEMKWMIGEIEKILPQYQESSGYLNYLTNSQEEEIRKLSIGGNSIQHNKQGATLGEGDYIELNNSTEEIQKRVNYNEKIDEVLEGNTKQETREGYNLLSYPYLNTTKTTNGITFTDIGDGTIKANGTATADAYFNLSQPSIKAGTYLYTTGVTGSTSTYYCKFNTVNITSKSTITLSSETVPSESYIVVKNGITVNNLIFKPMLIRGTVEKPYQQYGLMPSLDFPSEVKGVRGYNILKIKDMEETDYNGLKVSIKDNVITLNGTPTKNIDVFSLLEEDMELDVGDYYLMYKTENPASVNSGGFYLSDANNVNIVNSLFWNNANKIVSIKEKTVVNMNKTYIYSNANFVYNNTKQTIMLVRIYSKLEYLPYNTIKFENQGSNLYNGFDKIIGAWDNNITIDEDGWITANADNSAGTGVKFLNFWTDINRNLQTNKDYYIVFEFKDKSGSNIAINVVDNFMNNAQFSKSFVVNSNNLKQGDILITKIKTLSNFSTSTTMLRSYCYISPKLKGSITFRISVLSEEPNMYLSENHFDISNMTLGRLNWETGLPEDNVDTRIRTKDYIPLKAGIWRLTFSGLTQVAVYRFDSKKQIYEEDKFQNWVATQDKIIELKEDGYITCTFSNSTLTAITVSDLINPMLVEKKTTFDYKPFVNQSFPVSLGNETLYGDDNTRDYFDIEIDNKIWQQTGYKKITNAYLVKNWGKYEFTGEEDIFFSIVQGDYFLAQFRFSTQKRETLVYSNKFIYRSIWGVANSVEGINSAYNQGSIIQIKVLSSRLSEVNVNGFKQFLSNNDIYIVYQLDTPTKTIINDATQLSQLEALINMKTYEEQNNIVGFGDLSPYIKLSTITTPSFKYSSKVYSVGEIRNLIDIPDFNITYNQKYSEDTNTRFLLKPGYIYTLSFNFNIVDSSTDIYYSIGYGINSYENDIQRQIQYSSVTTAKNSVTFIVPEEIPELATLWVKFAETLILADVNVDIQNIQLNKGKEVLSYQKPNLYDIYPIITGKNLYNYNEAMYLITKNASYQEMTNGYVLTPISTTNEAVLKIGYPNRLVAGNTYGISYLYEGNIGGLKLYTTIKGLSQITGEIEINKGKFVAPEGVYDLQLEFSVDNSSLNNSVEVYNIQIENNEVSEYETHEENKNMLVLDEPLRGIGDYRDLVCLESPNLLNPESQSAIVKGNATYYLSQTGNTSYTINYLNEDNNVISSVSLVSGVLTTPENCVEIVIPNITKEAILTNRLQINIGNTALIYYPYINEPSIIRQTFKYIFTGAENPYISTVSSNKVFIFELFKDQLYKSNIINTVYCNYFLGITNNEWQNIIQIRNDLIWGNKNGFINLIHSGFNSVAELKTKFAELNNLNTPVEVIGILNEPIVEPLSQENINALQGLKTYTPISNVFTNNDSLGYLDFEYIKSYENQRTDNAYILLKCWNMNNKMPYVIHSNYIDIPEDIDKVFIWLRRKDNLFDLTIQNLYDYNEGDPSSDKTKPTVVLTIHEDQITNNSIPCTATCVDDYGLKTIRFSKNNGASWDKIINVDQLNVVENYTFENLIANTQYTIRAEAVDLAGNIGGMSVITKTK